MERVILPLSPTRLLLAGYSAGSLAASSSGAEAIPATCSICYLLISYPLSVLPFLTFFRSSSFHSALATLIATGAPVLAVFGDGDQFTGEAKYRAWADSLSKIEGGAWTSVEIEDADHFWQRRERKQELLATVERWLHSHA